MGDWNYMWKEKGATDQIVQQHDRVVGINTQRPSMGTDIMEKLRESIGQVTLVMQRPVRRTIAITKTEGNDLGITFVDGYSFLLVTSIGEGVIKDHNNSADPKDVIRLPSLIATVDGEKGSGSELFTRMQESVDIFEVELLYYDLTLRFTHLIAAILGCQFHSRSRISSRFQPSCEPTQSGRPKKCSTFQCLEKQLSRIRVGSCRLQNKLWHRMEF